MIIWLSGNSRAGKTTLAQKLIGNDKRTIWLDGDIMRASINRDCDMSENGRRENNLRIARLAKELHSQGFNIVVSVIAPYKKLREEIKEICDCVFIFIDGEGREMEGKDYPYEWPEDNNLLNFKITI